MTQLRPDTIRQASAWMARLWADDASAEDLHASLEWRRSAPEHEAAWQQLEKLQGRFDSLPGADSRVLAAPHASRRQVLAWAGMALGAGSLFGLSQTPVWQDAMADHHTGAGERQSLELADGSRLLLNTRTRLNVQHQALQLLEGELLLDMRGRKSSRPLLVQTDDIVFEVSQARCSIRHTDATTLLGVYAGSIDRFPRMPGSSLFRLGPGEGARFGDQTLLATQPALESDTAWIHGKLVAERMPVDRFVMELARYRSGLLQVDPALAGLSVTGVFSITDTDQALEQLANIHPVRIVRRTGYWTRVIAT